MTLRQKVAIAVCGPLAPVFIWMLCAIGELAGVGP